jgi:Ca2+-binding RTX toxin-like protein
MPAPIKSKADFTISTAGGLGELLPWVTAGLDGRFNVNYTFKSSATDEDALIQLYDASGTALMKRTIAGLAPSLNERMSSSTFLADGRQVFVWTERPDAGGATGTDIYYEVLYADGSVSIPRTVVRNGVGDQVDPTIAASPDGGFAIALNDKNFSTGKLHLRTYDLSGKFVTEIAPATGTPSVSDVSGDVRDFAVTGLTNGNYVVTWADAIPNEVRGRIVTSDGSFIGGEFVFQGGSNAAPEVAALADGRFVVVQTTSGGSIRAAIYTEAGVLDTGFAIATDGNFSSSPKTDVAGLQDGRFVVVWENTARNIEGQILRADGTKDGNSFEINTNTAGVQQHASVAVLADGRFVVSWEDFSSGTGRITSTIFDPREAGLSGSATSLNDDWQGTIFADTVYMGIGNDNFAAGSGNDLVYGESGRDTLRGGSGDDRLDGGSGIDTMYGDGGNDLFYVDNAKDIVIEAASGGAADRVLASVSYTLATDQQIELFSTTNSASTAALSLTGNNRNNTILGNNGNNALDGGGGVDKMTGLGGNDQYYIDNALDTVYEAVNGGAYDRVYASVNYSLTSGQSIEILTTINPVLTDALNLTGNEIANTIYGNAGDNIINGGLGSDTIYAGAGFDRFVFNTSIAGGGNVDSIDMKHIIDEIELSQLVFTGIGATLDLAEFKLGTAATTPSERIIYNDATGLLYFDSDGVGGVAQIQFARASVGAGLDFTDFIMR